MRTGEYRICAHCETRNKAGQPLCVHCGRALAGASASRAPTDVDVAPGGRWIRMLMAVGVILAIVFGVMVRKTFRGADIERNAMAQDRSASGPVPPTLSAEAVPAPPAPTARDFEKGQALLERGDSQAALRVLTPVAQAEPDNAVVAHTYGRALWATGSRDRAIVQFERAARADPHAPEYRIELGNALAAARRTREAIREYEAAVSLDPGNADTLVALANLYARAGDAAESRALLERAVALRPGDATLAQRMAAAETGPTSYTPSTPSAIPASSAVSASSSVSASSAVAGESATRPGAVVYTEEDLRRAGTGRTPGAVAPKAPPPIVRADDGQALGEAESKWREKAGDRREALRSAEQLVAAQKAQVASLQRQAESQTSSPDIERELTRALEDLDESREQLAKAQRRWQELEDEARRKSIPADWLR
jgi:tetratricopeptide (TPR) repeat protein